MHELHCCLTLFTFSGPAISFICGASLFHPIIRTRPGFALHHASRVFPVFDTFICSVFQFCDKPDLHIDKVLFYLIWRELSSAAIGRHLVAQGR
jgi:hypothetical protein